MRLPYFVTNVELISSSEILSVEELARCSQFHAILVVWLASRIAVAYSEKGLFKRWEAVVSL